MYFYLNATSTIELHTETLGKQATVNGKNGRPPNARGKHVHLWQKFTPPTLLRVGTNSPSVSNTHVPTRRLLVVRESPSRSHHEVLPHLSARRWAIFCQFRNERMCTCECARHALELSNRNAGTRYMRACSSERADASTIWDRLLSRCNRIQQEANTALECNIAIPSHHGTRVPWYCNTRVPWYCKMQ